MDALEEGVRRLTDNNLLQSVIVAVVFLTLTFVVAHYAVRLTRKLLSFDGVPLPSASIIVNIVRIIVWSIGGSIVLSSCFGIDVGALVTALGIGGIALTFGLQDTISNFIGGLQVTLMRIVEPGDHVIIGECEGIVSDITWRQTVVHDFENNVHMIPNAKINSGEVIKVSPSHLVATLLSFTNDTRDLDETIRTMEALAKDAVAQVAELERDPWILLTQIGEYGTWAKMRFILKDMDHVREARDAALRAVSPYTRVDSGELCAPSGKSPAEMEMSPADESPAGPAA